MHGLHFSRPSEQTKIIQIISLVPTYSLVSWFCILVPQAFYSIDPWLDVVQSIRLAAFFLLMCEFVSPSEDQRTMFFAGLDIPSQRDKKNKPGMHYDTREKKIVWYRRKWIGIFQYPVVALFVAVVTDISQATGRYCGNSYAPRFAHLWMTIFSNVSVTVAITAILLMYKVLRPHIVHHRPLAKLGAIKLVVGLAFIQDVLFALLQGANIIKPTATLTYADIKVGIPTMLTCIEMVPISFFFYFAYPFSPYSLNSSKILLPPAESKIAAPAPVSSYQGGFLGIRAYLAALNPMEILQGIMFALKMATEYRKMEQSGHGAALEPLRPNAASPVGFRLNEPGQTYNHGYADANHQGGTTYSGAYDQGYDGYSYGSNPDYTRAGQDDRNDAHNGPPEYGRPFLGPDSQQYGVTPTAPRASHSRSVSRNGEGEHAGRNPFEDGR